MKVDLVLKKTYEVGHPDHDATAFIVSSAIRLLNASERIGIVEMSGYHNGPKGVETGTFLGDEDAVLSRVLSVTERALKKKLLGCYKTQQSTFGLFGLSEERFRPAPEYDFTLPPHAGQLFYEQFPWGMSGSRFCELAAEALDELGLDPVNQTGRIYLR
jgi:hypothetical protein